MSAQENRQSADEYSSDTVDGGGLQDVGDPGTLLLERFSEKWNVTDAVADADVVDVESEEAYRIRHDYLHVDESIEHNVSHPTSRYGALESERVPLDRRYEHVPVGWDWEEETIEFIEAGQSPRECPKCNGDVKVACSGCGTTGTIECHLCRGSLTETCQECSGRGTERCSKCRGHGTVRDGDEEIRCPLCSGSGEIQCSRCNGGGQHTCTKCGGTGSVSCGTCSGSGMVTCPTCKGDGQVVNATRGTLELTHEFENEFESRAVPPSFIDDDAGSLIHQTTEVDGERPPQGEEGLYRHDVTRFAVPTTAVTYEYDGETYEFYEVEGDLSASTYPKSRARKLVTVVGIAAVVVALVGAAWSMGYLSPLGL